MFSLLIAILCGFLSSVVAGNWVDSRGWTITIGCIVFLLISILLNRHFGKKLTAIVDKVQELLKESQDDAYKMINRFQSKPMGSQKVMERTVEKKVEAGVLKALELLETVNPLYKWSLLAERQINTYRDI